MLGVPRSSASGRSENASASQPGAGRDGPPVARVVVVETGACHFCETARAVLAELRQEHALAVGFVDIDSIDGSALIREHRPAMYPLVLVDDEYFSAGRLPRRKLERLLRDRAAR